MGLPAKEYAYKKAQNKFVWLTSIPCLTQLPTVSCLAAALQTAFKMINAFCKHKDLAMVEYLAWAKLDKLKQN